MVSDKDYPLVLLVASFVAAVGLGTMAAAAWRLLLPEAGGDVYLSVFAAFCGFPLLLAGAAVLSLMLRTAEASARVMVIDAQTRLAKATPAPIVPTTVVYPRIVGGTLNGKPYPLALDDERPARWLRWQEFSLTLLDWYEARRSLTSPALVGKGLAFNDPAGWGEATDEWARVGLCDKSNGVRTVLTASASATRVRIESGDIEWTDEADPPAIAPAPAPDARRAVVHQGA